jgi:hypothetical protein
MTRICMWCEKPYGERCPECGSAFTEPFITLFKEIRFMCRPCAHRFKPGDGGTTHGICDACAPLPPEQQRAIHRAAIERQKARAQGDFTIKIEL